MNGIIDWLSDQNRRCFSLAIVVRLIGLLFLVIASFFKKKFLHNQDFIEANFFGYFLEDAQKLLNNYGENGRNLYEKLLATIDNILSVIYANLFIIFIDSADLRINRIRCSIFAYF